MISVYVRVRRWILPALATMAFLLLMTHRSEPPFVFNRYSIDYTVLLALAGLNLGLLWRSSMLRVSYRKLMSRPSRGTLISLALLIPSVTFLVDLIIGFPSKLSDYVNLLLLAGILVQLIQTEWQRSRSGILSKVALCMSSILLGIILLEFIFVYFLLENQTPKLHSQFLRLISSYRLWPQPVSPIKPPGTFRIIGLADSFGTAGGLSSNYHYQLEDILRSDMSSIHVVNVSIPAYEPPHHLAILPFAMKFAPDVVVHGFFVGNDFSLRDDDMYLLRGIDSHRPRTASPYRPSNFLVRGWIENWFKVREELRKKNEELNSGIVSVLGSYAKDTFLKLQFRRMNRWASVKSKNVDRMKEVLTVVDQIRSLVENNGARYVMVIHPDQVQVDVELRKEILDAFGANEGEYDFDLPSKILLPYCDKRRIPCLDLGPTFRESGVKGNLYLLRDTHYNENGNKLAASTIAQFLRRKGLLGLALKVRGRV